MGEIGRFIDDEVEKYAHYLERDNTGLPFPTRLIGLKAVLSGWGQGRAGENLSPEERVDRDRFFQLWSKDAAQFFLDLKETHKSGEPWHCFFEIGPQEAKGHGLRPLSDSYALYEDIPLFPGHKYHIDYANFHQVPQHSTDYDLPIGNFSSIYQLYVGDTKRQVALSLKQLRDNMLAGGDLRLVSRFW